jgi:hypothetical protein
MTKDDLRDLVRNYGEAVITYRSQESRKLKYNVCTLDFNNKYIQQKQNRAKESEDTLLLWCWDVDAYRMIRAADVTSVRPLAEALRESVRGR